MTVKLVHDLPYFHWCIASVQWRKKEWKLQAVSPRNVHTFEPTATTLNPPLLFNFANRLSPPSQLLLYLAKSRHGSLDHKSGVFAMPPHFLRRPLLDVQIFLPLLRPLPNGHDDTGVTAEDRIQYQPASPSIAVSERVDFHE